MVEYFGCWIYGGGCSSKEEVMTMTEIIDLLRLILELLSLIVSVISLYLSSKKNRS